MRFKIALAWPLVVGKPGRSVTFDEGSESCIILRLPAGSSPRALPSNLGDKTIDHTSCQTAPILPVDGKGKFTNVLLGQTITLGLNVRYDANLGSLLLCHAMNTQKALPGSDNILGNGNDVPDPGPDGILGTADDPVSSFIIPQAVLNALSSLSLGVNVNGLLELADRALAGRPTGGAAISQINMAVDAINIGFDGCQFLIFCGEVALAVNLSPSTASAPGAVPSDYVLKQNYPNPFNAGTQIVYLLPRDGNVDLTLYNVLGQRVRTLVSGFQPAGRYTVGWDGTDGSSSPPASGVYFYRLVAGEFGQSREMLLLK